MKKMRIMVLALMVMAMAAGLLSGPGTAHAEGSTPEIVLGAGEIAKATSTARNYTVWFGRYNDSDWGNGPVQWRVLSGGGSADPDDGTNLPVSGTGEALLISKDLLDVDCYFKQDCSSNQWAGSDAQAWCTAFWNSSNWLTAAEKSAVNATTVNEQNDQSVGSIQYFYRGGHYNDLYSAAPLNGEHIFFLSAREADQLFAGDDDRKAGSPYFGPSWWWWLRSPPTHDDDYSGYVNDYGWVHNTGVDDRNGARPAFNLNLSSVLFSSLIQSNQYKLTLADSNRTIGIQPGAAITRDSATQITVPYTKDSGSNHVSLLITNKDDAWTAGSGWSTGAVKQYYATAAVSEANGTVTFTLPDNYETNKGNWQVWLLAEQVNGEHETDCASAPVAITVPAYMPKVAYVDAKGNTPANSPVACTPVTASDTTWGAAGHTTWYAVTDSVTITSRVKVQGSVNLILCDGETLKAKEGITVSGDNNSLTIWAQSGGTGTLYAGTTNGTDSTCPDYNAGIGGGYYGAGGKVTVNGGTVNARGGQDAAGIGGGDEGAGGEVTVNSGTVYGEQTTQLIMVTLRVVHGEWGDELGGREDRTIFLEGPIGEELWLQFEQIPNVDKPDAGYSAATGSWDKEPSFTLAGENYGDPITEDTVYTFTYGKIQDQPAGSETGNTETKPGAPVLGATNMDEVVKSVVEAIKNGKLTDVKDEVKQALSQPGAIVTLTLVSKPLADNEIPAQDKNALDRVMQTSGYDGYTAFDLSLLLTVKNPATGETVTEYLHASSKEVTFTLNCFKSKTPFPLLFSPCGECSPSTDLPSPARCLEERGEMVTGYVFPLFIILTQG